MVLPCLVSSVFGVYHRKEFFNPSLALPVLLASFYYTNLASHSRDNTRLLGIPVFMKHLELVTVLLSVFPARVVSI